MASMSDEEALASVEAFRARYLALTPTDNFDRNIWKQLNIISASVSRHEVIFSIQIPDTYSNHLGTVQGGAVATLFDGITGSVLAILAGQDPLWTGKEVSRDLQIKFFRPIPTNQTVDAKCLLINAGSRLATLRGQLRRREDGALLAECIHEKYNPVNGARSKL